MLTNTATYPSRGLDAECPVLMTGVGAVRSQCFRHSNLFLMFSDKLSFIITYFLQTTAFGINIISFCYCISTLVLSGGKLRRIKDIPWWMVSVAIAMFSISAADAIIELHFRVALFYEEDPKASLDFEGNFQWWSDVSFGLYVVQTWIGDSVLIYRCFRAWNKNIRIIVFSVLTSLTGLAVGITATVIAAGSTTISNREKNLTPLIITFYAMAMSTNCVTSSLIVSRIWNVRRGSSRYRSFVVSQQDPLSRAIRITIEAGLIYSISLVALLIVYLTHHNSQFGVQRILIQIIAITFNLIIVHSERGSDSSRDSASFRRFSQAPMVITKDVVVTRDPPAPEDSIPSHESA